MKKLSRFFYKLSRGWVVLTALVIFLLFAIFILPEFSVQATRYGGGIGAPDTTLFYSGEDLFAMAEVYGEEGRAAFIDMRWTYDLVFPLVYTFFLVTSVSWLLRHVVSPGSRWRLLNVVPLAAFLLDILENSATSLVMARYPLRCLLGEISAPIISPLKWVAVGLSFAIVIYALAIFLLRLRKKDAR